MGYPGSGKTSAALEIAQLTGAEHLWADKIRRQRLGQPTYSHQENMHLYQEMNQRVAELLATGKSVVFDTAFNFYKDREHLREVARSHGAECVLLWLKVDRDTAKERALMSEIQAIRPLGHDMKPEDFERMADNLEAPHADEAYIALDGTQITSDYIRKQLNLG